MTKLYTYKHFMKYGQHIPSDRYFLNEDKVKEVMLAHAEKVLKRSAEQYGGNNQAVSHDLSWSKPTLLKQDIYITYIIDGNDRSRELIGTMHYKVCEISPEDA